jgi:hypothetical protein
MVKHPKLGGFGVQVMNPGTASGPPHRSPGGHRVGVTSGLITVTNGETPFCPRARVRGMTPRRVGLPFSLEGLVAARWKINMYNRYSA